ncbi:MAG: hypothetical protein ACR2RB_03310, partial [Gammaproteobacteria bacterium]
LAEVLTVDEVEREYEGDWLYDMEAAGFFSAATRFSTAELAQCYKIVSDNIVTSPEQLSRDGIAALVESRASAIDALVQQLADVRETVVSGQRAPVELQCFLERWRFTVTQRKLLTRLLQRWQALNPDQSSLTDDLLCLRTGTEVLARVRRLVEACATRVDLIV